jgi:nicotinamide riboside kinase
MEPQTGQIIRIALVGPESTGKSSLSAQLANHYRTRWVPEYARSFLEARGGAYAEADLWPIAAEQLQSIHRAEQAMKKEKSVQPLPLFIDTELHVMRIWSEFVFHRCDDRILKALADQPVDAFLLCDTDLPWQPDPLREQPDPLVRQRIFQYYLDALVHQALPWQRIQGQDATRLNTAIQFVDRLMNEFPHIRI